MLFCSDNSLFFFSVFFSFFFIDNLSCFLVRFSSLFWRFVCVCVLLSLYVCRLRFSSHTKHIILLIFLLSSSLYVWTSYSFFWWWAIRIKRFLTEWKQSWHIDGNYRNGGRVCYMMHEENYYEYDIMINNIDYLYVWLKKKSSSLS